MACVTNDIKHLPQNEFQHVPSNLVTWNSYVRDLNGCDHIQDAAIYDHHGNLLSSTANWSLGESEYSHLLLAMNVPDIAHQEGVTINSHRYAVRLADGKFGMMLGGRRQGCSVCKTSKLLIIATHKGLDMDASICNEMVMTLGDFFISKGL